MRQEDVRRLSMEQIRQQVEQGHEQTDWPRVAQQAETTLDSAANDDGEFDWTRASLELPSSKKQLTVRLDIDVIEWFRAQGEGYQTRMNQVLRRYVAAQKD